jgi:hypothetical protein
MSAARFIDAGRVRAAVVSCGVSTITPGHSAIDAGLRGTWIVATGARARVGFDATVFAPGTGTAIARLGVLAAVAVAVWRGFV